MPLFRGDLKKQIENLRTGRILRILILHDIYVTSMYNIYNGKKGVTPWYFFFLEAIDSYRVVYATLRLMLLKYNNSENFVWNLYKFKEEKFILFLRETRQCVKFCWSLQTNHLFTRRRFNIFRYPVYFNIESRGPRTFEFYIYAFIVISENMKISRTS